VVSFFVHRPSEHARSNWFSDDEWRKDGMNTGLDYNHVLKNTDTRENAGVSDVFLDRLRPFSGQLSQAPGQYLNVAPKFTPINQ
jgi:hypothetical protein